MCWETAWFQLRVAVHVHQFSEPGKERKTRQRRDRSRWGVKVYSLLPWCPSGTAPAGHGSCTTGHLCPTAAAGQRGLYQQTELTSRPSVPGPSWATPRQLLSFSKPHCPCLAAHTPAISPALLTGGRTSVQLQAQQLTDGKCPKITALLPIFITHGSRQTFSNKGQIVTILGVAGYIVSREGTDQLVERLAIQKGPSRHHHGRPLNGGVNNHTVPQP